MWSMVVAAVIILAIVVFVPSLGVVIYDHSNSEGACFAALGKTSRRLVGVAPGRPSLFIYSHRIPEWPRSPEPNALNPRQ